MLMQVSNKKYMYFEIDDEDFDKVKSYRWSLNSDGYITRARKPNQVELLHRLILGLKTNDGNIVDHIDGNPSNNKKENLRVCNQQQNTHNRRKISTGATSIYKGVNLYKYKMKDSWRATIRFNDKNHYLGVFDTEIEAATVYDTFAIKHFGEFAKLNFPEKREELSKVECIIKRFEYSNKTRGIIYAKRDNVWKATCRINGKPIYIGSFKSEEDAVTAQVKFLSENGSV